MHDLQCKESNIYNGQHNARCVEICFCHMNLGRYSCACVNLKCIISSNNEVYATVKQAVKKKRIKN